MGAVFSSISVRVTQQEGAVAVQVFGLGTVEARVTSKVGFKASGVLLELRADVGDRVSKDTVLARLDDREQAVTSCQSKSCNQASQRKSSAGNCERSKGTSELYRSHEYQ